MRTPPTAASAVSKPGSLYLFNPAVDLTVVAGGLTFLLFPLCLLVAHTSARLNTVGFLVLLFFCNFPHYMATNYRIYHSRSQIQRYKFFSIHVTGILALTALSASLLANTQLANVAVKVLYTVYFAWSPYHYTGQNYGLSIMYLRRGGCELSKLDRRLLYGAFVACFPRQEPLHGAFFLAVVLEAEVEAKVLRYEASLRHGRGGIARVSDRLDQRALQPSGSKHARPTAPAPRERRD